MALNNEISWKFLLFLQHHRPHTYFQEPNPVRWTTGHTHYMDGQDYGFIMGLINEIAQKFPLFSPFHLHHFTSTTSPPLHIVSGRLPLHRGTTNLTQSVRPQYTHPIWTDKTLWLYGLNNDISRKCPLFSPHHRPHTHCQDASPFIEVQ